MKASRTSERLKTVISPTLGAPGIYETRAQPTRRYSAIPLDTCAFVGLAPRGPAFVPQLDELGQRLQLAADVIEPTHRSVPRLVHSWDEYRWLYGGYENGWKLATAVAAFFRQGGRRAWIVRVVPPLPAGTDLPVGRSSHIVDGFVVGGPLRISASNEGVWGDRLRVTLSTTRSPLAVGRVELATGSEDPRVVRMRRASLMDVAIRPFDLIRVGFGGVGDGQLVFVDQVTTLDEVVTVRFDADLRGSPIGLERVEAEVEIVDSDAGMTRRETFSRLGLHAEHPHHLVRTVDSGSELICFARADRDMTMRPSEVFVSQRLTATSHLVEPGVDRDGDVVPEDFADPNWLGDGDADIGVLSLCQLGTRAWRSEVSERQVQRERDARVAMVCLPDLAFGQPAPPSTPDMRPTAGAHFADCVELPPLTETEPSLTSDRIGRRAIDPERVTAVQQAVVRFAEHHRQFVILLDVPPTFGTRQALAWRSQFNSSYAAAYHPWVSTAQTDAAGRLLRVDAPPSSFAAGIIAARELALGIPWGPANEFLVGAVGAVRRVPPHEHDSLHLAGINVMQQDPGGVVLTAARTLSTESNYRQLNVRRLMTMIRLTLEEQSQWVVFEPNDSGLRQWLRHSIEGYLEQLFVLGAFAGGTTHEAYFVNVGDDLNSRRSSDRGELLVEIGVAPVEPIEYLVLTIAADSDGLLQVAERRG